MMRAGEQQREIREVDWRSFAAVYDLITPEVTEVLDPAPIGPTAEETEPVPAAAEEAEPLSGAPEPVPYEPTAEGTEPVPAGAEETEPLSGAPELEGNRSEESEPPAPSAARASPRLPGGRAVHGAVAATVMLGSFVAGAFVHASGGSHGSSRLARGSPAVAPVAAARGLLRGHVGDPGDVAAVASGFGHPRRVAPNATAHVRKSAGDPVYHHLRRLAGSSGDLVGDVVGDVVTVASLDLQPSAALTSAPTGTPATGAPTGAPTRAPTSAPCADDPTWTDRKYGDYNASGVYSYCADVALHPSWCTDYGDYSTEAQSACPVACGACPQAPTPTPAAAEEAVQSDRA